MTAQPFVVWAEIPVSDMQKSVAFYNTVFGWTLTIDDSGPNPVATFGNTAGRTGGHLSPGKPGAGAGATVHLAVTDSLAAATDRLKLAGGKVLGGPIEIPVGSFTYCTDLDGNSIGLFEPKAA